MPGVIISGGGIGHWPEVPNMEHLRVSPGGDQIAAKVDGKWEVFSREDKYGGHPGSGLASFGSVCGDWRMISTIQQEIEWAFEIMQADSKIAAKSNNAILAEEIARRPDHPINVRKAELAKRASGEEAAN